MGQSVLSPHTASRAKGRASLTFPTRRPSRPCVLAARLRRCEPRRRPNVHRSHCALDVGSSSTSGSRSFAASPRFHATVPASTQPPVLSSMKVVPPVGAARRGVSSMKTRGPRCKTSARAASSSSCGRLRWAGGGSHRLAVPGRGSCLLVGVSTGSGVTLTRSKRLVDGRCWTQRRPPAGSSR